MGGGSYSSESQSRVIRLRGESDEELVIEEHGTNTPLTVSASGAGVVVGCTRLSWRAWDYIMTRVQEQRNLNV